MLSKSYLRPLDVIDDSLFFKAERNNENDLIELENIAEDVIIDISQDVKQPKKKKLSRRKRNERNREVNICLFSSIFIF